jgi:hypothetical protein
MNTEQYEIPSNHGENWGMKKRTTVKGDEEEEK